MSSATVSGPWAAVVTIAAASDRMTRAAGRQAAEAARRTAAVRELRAELAAMRGMSSRPPASDPRASSGPILPPESGPGAHAPRVLLVEDQAIVASHAARKLESEGYVVRVAASGSEACSLLSEEPDVVICDLQLGAGCSGLAVAREARQRCPGAIVVLWSGELSGLALAEAQHKTGAHAASEKGRGVQDLIAAIRSAEVSRGAK